MWYLLFLFSLSSNVVDNSYNAFINKAEMALVTNDCNTALIYYDSAMSIRPFALGQDIYNASICALNTGNYRKAFELGYKLAYKGVGPQFFQFKSCFAPIRQQKGWREFIKKVRKINAEFLYRNKDALALIDNLLLRSNGMQASIIEFDGLPELRFRADLLYDQLSTNLASKIQSGGYLSEEKVGMNVINDTILSAAPRFLPIMQYRSRQYNADQGPEFRKLFKSALDSGLVKPEYFLQLVNCDRTYEESLSLYYFVLFGCDLYKTKGISESQANSIRQSTGLSNLSDYLKKIEYSLLHPDSNYLLNVFVPQQKGVVAGGEEFSKFLANNELVKQAFNPDCPK